MRKQHKIYVLHRYLAKQHLIAHDNGANVSDLIFETNLDWSHIRHHFFNPSTKVASLRDYSSKPGCNWMCALG